MNKGLKIGLTIIITIVLIASILVVSAAVVFRAELKTIKNIEKLDDHPFYVMNYDKDYYFDEFLTVGAKDDQELINFLMSKLFKGLPISIDVSDYACSTFNAVTEDSEYLFGRNFDWGFSPSMLLWTEPENGYKSVSMVNLGFLAYDETYLPDKYLNRFLTLAAPYAPLDGMNEKGLAIGVLQLMAEPTQQDTGKVPITTTAMIRLVLDKAATVEEAVELIGNYDMNDSVGGCYHYQITDATGASVVVEYVNNEMVVIYPEENSSNAVNYQIAANFFLAEDVEDEEGFGHDRYDIINDALSATGGVASHNQAMGLLEAARIDGLVWEDGWIDRTEWSAVYDLTNLKIYICVGMNYDRVFEFDINKPMEYDVLQSIVLVNPVA